MADKSTFETLALELSPQERYELLERMRRVAVPSTEPLFTRAKADADKVDYLASFKEFDIFTRLFITLRTLLGGPSRELLVRQRLVRGIERRIEARSPGLLEPRRRVLREPFYDQLSTLKSAARYFSETLSKALDKNRGPFFAFLASLEFESVHEELSVETDPDVFLERNALAADGDVRVAVNAALDSALARIDESQRRLMYLDVRSLHILKSLSVFPFDKFLSAFKPNAAGQRELSIYSASDLLSDLAAILTSLDTPPSGKLMETLIGFAHNEDFSNENFDIEGASRGELEKAEQALAAIRAFNARVPIEALLKLAYEDPNWQCATVGGGEDWFALFKAYWRERVDKRYQRFSSERRLALLESEMTAMVGHEQESYFESLFDEEGHDSPPIGFAKPLRFLAAFYHRTFLSDINRCLKLILLEGEFYKRDNRLDFTDAYNELLQLGETLKAFDARLSPNGEYGMAYRQAVNELAPNVSRRKRIDQAVRAANGAAEAIITHAAESMTKMHIILKGVLAGDARGRYDSLANISRLDGRANADFIKSLEAAKDRLERACHFLEEMARAAIGAGTGSP